MSGAHLATQLVVSMPTRVGLLADLTDAIKEAGVNITAISAYERDGEGKFLMLTDDNDKASAALARLNANVREKSAIVLGLENRPGALEDAVRKLAEADVNVEYAYGSTAGGGEATVVLSTADDMRAIGLI